MPYRPMQKVCRGCGKIFTTTDKRSKFCSWECFNHYVRRGNPAYIDKVCAGCGKTFKVQYGQRNKKFCSLACSGRHHMTPEKQKKMLKARWRYRKYLDKKWVRRMFEQYKRFRGNIDQFVKKYGVDAGNLMRSFRKFMPGEYESVIESKMSHSTAYRRGRNFEYRVRNFFRRKGYFVLRSPRSGGPVDLVALKKGEVLLIQCKVSRSFLGKKEKNEIIRLARDVGGIPFLAYREPKPPKYPIHFTQLE